MPDRHDERIARLDRINRTKCGIPDLIVTDAFAAPAGTMTTRLGGVQFTLCYH
jgi:hypothetical protein